MLTRGLSDVDDEDVFDKYKLNELCVYPRQQIKRLIEQISKFKSFKAASEADVLALKKRLPGYELKLSESEAEVYKLTFNCEQLRKQNETVVKNFDQLKEQKEKQIRKMEKSNEKVQKELQERLEGLLEEKQRRVRDQSKAEGDSQNLLRRKDHTIHNLRNDLEDLQVKLRKSNESLKQQNQKYGELYREFKGRPSVT